MAKTQLSIWKGDLVEEGSFDDAIQGCEGVIAMLLPTWILLLPRILRYNYLCKPE